MQPITYLVLYVVNSHTYHLQFVVQVFCYDYDIIKVIFTGFGSRTLSSG